MPDRRRQTMPPRTGASPPVFNVPAVVLATVGVLIAIHVALWLLGESWQVWSLYALAFIPSRLGGGEAIPAPAGSQAWSFVTYALLHADAYHLGANSIWLLIFSTPLARRLGSLRYLLLLAAASAAGAAAMLAFHWGQFLIVLGASAAVSGAMAAAIPIMFSPGFQWHARHADGFENLNVLRFPELLRSRSAIVFACVFLALTVLTGASQSMIGTAFLEERAIAWEAHLGGFIVGLAAFYLLDRRSISSQTFLQ